MTHTRGLTGRPRRLFVPIFMILVICVCGMTVMIWDQVQCTCEFKWLPRGDINADALNPMLHKYHSSSDLYTILLVSDRDQASRDSQNNRWTSLFARVTLQRYQDQSVSGMQSQTRYRLLEGRETRAVSGQLSENGRGMELSELKWFGNRLYTIDDRTGVLYQVMLGPQETEFAPRVLPRLIFMDGNGVSRNKGFKAEWMTVKDRHLIVGGMGKEWTHAKTGDIIGDWPMWVKSVSYDASTHNENVKSENFATKYNRLRGILLGSDYMKTGAYILHEAIEWSDHHQRWFFLPRRVSRTKYNEDEDLHRGANVILSADESFENIKIVDIRQETTKTRGFSTFKFVPHRPNEIVAIKSEETADGITHSYITVITVDGDVLMPETLFTSEKFEGLEFV